MNTIETEVWTNDPDKPGYLKFSHAKTILHWCNEVVAAVKALTPDQKYGAGDFEWFGLSTALQYHNINGWTKFSTLPRNARLICYCEQGGSAGYIVNVMLVPEGAATIGLIHGKCFDREYAWKATRQISEILGIMPAASNAIVYTRCIIPATDGAK